MIIIKLKQYSTFIKTEFAAILRQKENFQILPRYSTKAAVNLSYKIFGEPAVDSDEPTILLIHGLLASKKHWNAIGKTIFNIMKKAVVSVDLRNHGYSPHVDSHMYEDLAADILKLLDKLSIKRASLVGHSMGGRAAMVVSLSMPDRIAGLLVVDISPISTARHLTDFIPKVLAAMRKVDFNKVKNIKAAVTTAKEQLKNIIKDDVLMNAVVSNIKLKSDGTIGWACNIDILTKHLKYIATFPEIAKRKTYNGPTLFIGGQLSEYLPADDLPGIREMFPHATVTYIPQTGHNLHADDPNTFLELAIAFLRTNK